MKSLGNGWKRAQKARDEINDASKWGLPSYDAQNLQVLENLKNQWYRNRLDGMQMIKTGQADLKTEPLLEAKPTPLSTWQRIKAWLA